MIDFSKIEENREKLLSALKDNTFSWGCGVLWIKYWHNLKRMSSNNTCYCVMGAASKICGDQSENIQPHATAKYRSRDYIPSDFVVDQFGFYDNIGSHKDESISDDDPISSLMKISDTSLNKWDNVIEALETNNYWKTEDEYNNE